MSSLTNISPLDGRYAEKLAVLSPYFSEMALMRYRLLVEVEYFIALAQEKKIKELPTLAVKDQKLLRSWYEKFTLSDAEQIKRTEKVTNHDVKSIEYFFKEKLATTSLKKYAEFIHFGLTSEDINNLAYSLMLRDSMNEVVLPAVQKVIDILKKLALQSKALPLLSLTHGQPATPTTVGKELAVFCSRLQKRLAWAQKLELDGKLNGATGNYAALVVAYPEVDWIAFSKRFVSQLGLEPNLLTTQIENHDDLTVCYDQLARINNVMRDLDQDMWLYISRGVFKLQRKEGEVGSSTMPHKVNPINFENSEGNLGIANSLLRFLSDKLPVSRLQRDLTDSTVIRNQGVALGHCLLAYQQILAGLQKVQPDEETIRQELNDHWEILAEAIQTVLRKIGYPKPYEALKELTRGEHITKEKIRAFIQKLNIPKKVKEQLLKLSPVSYTGLSSKLTDLIKNK